MTLEKRLKDVESSIKIIAQYVKEQTEKMDAEISSLKSEGPLEMPEIRQELEEIKKKVDAISVEKGGSILKFRRPEELTADSEERIKKYAQSLGSEFYDFKNEVAPKLQFIERKTDKLKEAVDASIGAVDFDELRRRMEKIDKKVTETLAMKSELDEAEQTLTKMKGIANKLKDFDADTYREEFNKHMSDMFGQFRELETHDIKGLKSKLEHLGRLEVDDIKKLNETTEHLKDIEAHDIKNFAKRMKEAKDVLEEEAISRIAFEKRIMDFESRLLKLQKSAERHDKSINEVLGQIKSAEMDDIKKVMEELLSEKELLEKESVNRISLEARVKELEAKIAESKLVEEVEELDVDRVSTEKKLHELESELTHMREVISKIESVEGGDIAKLSGRLQDMEGNMKMMTIRLLTQQLNEFAKSLDRRLPNVVSKEEYTRQIADMNRRMQTIEAPDLSPLGARVERLERKVEEVAAMMRQMYNRVPIIVE